MVKLARALQIRQGESAMWKRILLAVLLAAGLKENVMAGFWLPMDSTGANQTYYAPNGKNSALILNGKLLIADPANFNISDPDVQSMIQKTNATIGTAQDLSNAINEDAPGNGAGKGSMKEGVLSALAAAGSFYGAGQAINAFSPVAGAVPSTVTPSNSFMTLAEGGNTLSDASPIAAGAGADEVAGGLTGNELMDFETGQAQLSNAGYTPASFNATVPNTFPSAAAAAAGGAAGITTGQALSGAGAAASVAGGGGSGSTVGAGNGGIDDGALSKILNDGGPSAALSGTAIARILNGTATAEDYLKIGGAALPGVLGAITSNQQASRLSDLANEYKGFGAPSRARYEASFQPGFTMGSDPGYKDALDQAGRTTLHALSVNGNPAGSPNAWEAAQKDIYDKTAYPALQAYRNTNSVGGGLASGASAAPNLATKAIEQTGTTMADLGGAARDVFSPTSTLDELLKKVKGAGNIFSVAA